MDHYCVVGNPVEHSKSPQIHARFAALTGQDITYDKQLVALDGFTQALHRLQQSGVKGCNVTVPFKFEAYRCAQTRSSRAELAQAANTLRFDPEGIYADNTDGIGLVNDLQINAGISLTGRNILLVGAGGAAAGVLGPLLGEKPRRVVVANRTLQKAEALVAEHRAHHAIAPLLQNTELVAQSLKGLEGDFDVIINATASSLSGATIPVNARVLKPGALAYDMMYGPATDGFLKWARQHGAQGRDGLGMLVEQAAAAFEVWRHVKPPSAKVLVEMHAALQATAA